MNDWILSLAGTEAGHRAALGLALAAAVLHALFGALQKGRHDPWLARAGIDLSYGLIALPVALFVVPWPEPHMWPIFFGAFVIHAAYKWLQAMTFSRGAYTVVYPVVRGTGPLFTVLGAGFLFGEHYTPGQWGGVAVLLAGIFGLALYNARYLREAREIIGDRAWIGPPKIEDAGVGVGESHHLAARPVRVGQHVDHPAVKFGELVAEDRRCEPRQPIAHPFIGQRQPGPVHQFGVVDDTFGVEHVEVLVEEAGQRNPLWTLRRAPGCR